MTSIVEYPTLYTIWIMLSWSCEGGHYSIFPPLSGLVYGPKLGIKINALFFVAFGIASLLGVLLNATVVPMLGWEFMFITLGVMTCGAFVMNLFFKTDKEDKFEFIPALSPYLNPKGKNVE